MTWQAVDLTVDDPLEVFSLDPLELFAQALEMRPAWHAGAACRGHGPELWFPANGEPTAEALELCRRCPVRAECFEAGRGERYGVWGGTGEAERRRPPRRLGAERPPGRAI